MKYLLFLLVPLGIALFIISLKNLIRFTKTEILYEMSCSRDTGSFTLSDDGEYGLWISGKLFSVSPVGTLGFRIINQGTGEEIPLSLSIMRSKVNGFEKGRMELYFFFAKKGRYVISLDGRANAFDKVGASIMNAIIKKPVDLSKYSVQIRNHTPGFLLVLCILGVIFSSMTTLLGIILPVVL